MIDLSWYEQNTDTAPGVNYDKDKKQLTIDGKLIPEDPEIFFIKFYDWLERFFASPVESVELDLYLYYYNTSSLKRLTIFFSKLDERLKSSPKKVKIIWKCDEVDENNIADGEDLLSMFSLDMEIVKIAEEE